MIRIVQEEDFFTPLTECIDCHKNHPMDTGKWELNDDGYVQRPRLTNTFNEDQMYTMTFGYTD